MKKKIIVSLVAVTFAAASAFGQGYFSFTSGKSQAYDGFTTLGVSALGSTINVAFLWAAASTTPTIATDISAQSLKTGTNNQTGLGYTAATAWADILNGQFTFATNTGTGNLVVALTSTTGVIGYNPGAGVGAAFSVSNTVVNTTYTLYEVAWSSAYATPWLAAAANAAVGWSTAFQYASVTQTGFVNSMNGLAPSFGVFAPSTGAVPEPSTMALAAIGGASLLLFRRRK